MVLNESFLFICHGHYIWHPSLSIYDAWLVVCDSAYWSRMVVMEDAKMSIPTKMWLYMCAVIIVGAAVWYHGYHTADAAWQLRDTNRQLADAKAAEQLSEQYRAKEQKLNETIGEIETRAINDAANAEMEYKAVMDRLRNASAHPTDWLRVKPSLTCRSVPSSTSPTGNGNEEVQTGLSPEVAERVIGVGAECDQAIISLQACQNYVESIRKPLK